MKKVNSPKSELINKMIEEFNIKSASDLQEAMKELFGQTIQNMLQAEFEQHMGYEKSDNVVEKNNYRNGYSDKSVNTVFGEIDLNIPRDRNAEFEPVIVPKSKRDISGIEEKIIRLYGRGMSTRDISAELNELYGCELSPTMISRITDKVNDGIAEWQSRPLEERYATVFIDCIYNSVKVEGKVQKLATYVVLGIDLAGKKDILSITTGETESARFWHTVLLDLKNRGVKDIMIFCSDGLNGIVEAIEFAFPCAVYQRCVVHMVRNSLRYVNRKDYKEFCGDLKSVYNAISEEAGLNSLKAMREKWGKYPAALNVWEKNWTSIASMYNFSFELRKVMYTTNAIESLNRVFRKSTKTKSVFPTTQSLHKVMYLATMNIVGSWTKQIRNWAQILNELTILFGDRVK